MSILAKYNNKLKNVTNIYTHSNTAIKSVYDNNNNMIWGTILPTYVYIDQLNGTTIAKGNPSIWNQIHENEQNGGSSSGQGGSPGQGGSSGSNPGDDPSNPNPGTDPGSGQPGSESGSGGGSSSESFRLITYTDPYYFKEYKIKYNDTPKTLKQTNNLLPPLANTSFWTLGKIIYQNQIVTINSDQGPGFLSDFIEVQSNQEYIWYSSGGNSPIYTNHNTGGASSGHHLTIAQFDSEKNYVGNTLQGFEGKEAFRWTTPANVKYIRVSFTQPRNCMCLMKTGKEFSLAPPLTDTRWSKTLNTTNNTYTYSIHIKLKPKSYYCWNFKQDQPQSKTIYLYRQRSGTEYTTYRPNASGFGTNTNAVEGVFSTIVYNGQPYDDIDTISITINDVNENNLPQFYLYERSYIQKGYILPIKIKPYGSIWQFYECVLPESIEAWDYVHYKGESTSIAAISPFSQSDINLPNERTTTAQYYGWRNTGSIAYQYSMAREAWHLEQTSLNQVVISGRIAQWSIDRNGCGYLLPLIYYDLNRNYLIPQSLLCVTLHNLPRVDVLGEDFYIKIHFDSKNSNAPAEMLLATKQDIIEHPDCLNKSFSITQNFTCKGAYLQFFGMCTVDRLIMDINFLPYGSSPVYHSYTYYHKNQLINLSQLPVLSTTKNMTKIDVTTQPKPASFVIR